MNLEDVKAIAALFEKSSIAHLEYSEGGSRLVLSKGAPGGASAPQAAPRAGQEAESAPPPAAEEKGAAVVTSPVVGTLYRAKSPEDEPFVKVGSAVAKGDVLCLVEAMKMFNEITAPCDGVVRDILFADGDLAEHGMPLFKIGAV